MTSASDKPISQLDPANPVTGSEKFPIAQAGDTRSLTLDGLIEFILENLDTGDITEGINLYYTNPRADARVAIHADNVNNPHEVTLAQLGIPFVTNLKHNWTATSDPVAGDDFADGYTVGSLWLRAATPRLWICTSSTVGSAAWQVITFTKGDIGLGNVQNIDVTTWAGGTNITSVNQSAVTAHVGAINHNALLNFVSNKHIDHTTVTINTPAAQGLFGGANIASSLTLGLNYSGLTNLSLLDTGLDRIAVWDASASDIKYITPASIAATNPFAQLISTNGTITIDAAKRGAIYQLTNNSTLNFVDSSVLGAGFYMVIKPISSAIIVLNANAGDTIDGLTSLKFSGTNGCFIFADGNNALMTVGLNPEVLLIKDIKLAGTDGGTFTSGAWRKRSIQEISDGANLMSIASDVITLQPGKYEVDISCPASQVDSHQARLQNTTDGVTLLEGNVGFSSNAGTGGNTISRIQGEFSIAAVKAIEVQHICTTTKATTGFGMSGNFTNEIYTQGIIRRMYGLLL